jgi:hypothetical protein
VLAGYSPAPGGWPTQFLPDLTAAARQRYDAQDVQMATASVRETDHW